MKKKLNKLFGWFNNDCSVIGHNWGRARVNYTRDIWGVKHTKFRICTRCDACIVFNYDSSVKKGELDKAKPVSTRVINQ